jgi:hypothetical protein
MIKFAQQGPNASWVVFLGLSFENLERLAQGAEPIVFPAAQVGLGAGSFTMGPGGTGAALRAQLGADEVRCCLEFTQADADTLMKGGLVERSLQSLGFSRSGMVMVLLGKTERAIVETLRAAGLVSATTKFTELDAPTAAATPTLPSKYCINPQLIFAGLVFVAVGAMGVAAAKNPALGVLLGLGGAASIVWGVRYPRSR